MSFGSLSFSQERSIFLSRISDKVSEIAKPVVEKAGCELWDVEYVKEAGSWYLRVYIDKEGGVNITDCEAISRELDPMLDEYDFIQESYVFEVGSPGLERELKRPSDFDRYTGSEVEVKLYRAVDNSKSFVGTLAGYNDGNVTVKCPNSEYTFTKEQIAHVKLHVTI